MGGGGRVMIVFHSWHVIVIGYSEMSTKADSVWAEALKRTHFSLHDQNQPTLGVQTFLKGKN